MIKLLVIFCHLMAVCAAVGTMIAVHMRSIARLTSGKPAKLRDPGTLVKQTITGSLVVLWMTGAALVWMGMQEDPSYLGNPKLQAKILLVTLLSLNGIVLHRFTFPRLMRGTPGRGAGIVVPVALSSSLWLTCAFLGVAKPLNHVVPLEHILYGAMLAFLVAVAIVGAIVQGPAPQESRPLDGALQRRLRKA